MFFFLQGGIHALLILEDMTNTLNDGDEEDLKNMQDILERDRRGGNKIRNSYTRTQR